MKNAQDFAEDSGPMKRQLRQRMRRLLAGMPHGTAEDKSLAACRRIVALEEFAAARVVMIYVPLPGELDTTLLARSARREGKTILVPRVYWDRHSMTAVVSDWPREKLPVNGHGLRQPTDGQQNPLDEIDLIVTPGLAFDRLGNRLGRGGGYYDRFLSADGLRAVTCGLAFAEQVVEKLPTGPGDRAVQMIVTDREVLRFPAT